MKVPEIFTPDKTEEFKKTKKKYHETLEELVDDESLHSEIGKFYFGSQTKTYPNIHKYALITGINQMTSIGARTLVNRGINFEDVEKAFSASYYAAESYYHKAIFLQYKDATSLANNLEEIFLKGMRYDSEIKFTETLLFKDNLSVFLEGDKEFIKTLRDYYRKKGFKQINYKLEVV